MTRSPGSRVRALRRAPRAVGESSTIKTDVVAEREAREEIPIADSGARVDEPTADARPDKRDVLGTNASGQLQTVHARHQDVCHDQADGMQFEQLPGLVAVRSDDDVVARSR